MRRTDQKGFILLATVLGVTVLMGVSGLAIDVGRLYLVHDEVQAYADGAAIAAALHLDGTEQGFSNAEQAAVNLTAKWNFGTQAFSGTTVEFAQAREGDINAPDPFTWTVRPESGNDYWFARVTAAVNVPLTLLRAVTKQRSVQITGSAVARLAGRRVGLIQ